MDITAYLYSAGSAVYATLATLIAVQARQKANAVLAACCAVTAMWAATGAIWRPQPLEGLVGLLDLFRLLSWYVYLLYLYRKSEVGSSTQIYGFGLVAGFGLLAGIAAFPTLPSPEVIAYSVYSIPVVVRLVICISELLLIENLYFNLPENARWHVALPCILLGGLACFDILVVADTALFRRPSIPLESGRVVAMIIVAPLLVLAAFRGQRWSEPIRLSRAVVFHSATLVLSGSVLLSLALAGEVLRHLDETWGWVAELGLVFAGLICIMLFVSSRSARSLIDQMVVHHFFADRYDYRNQWLSCIATLSQRGSIEQNSLYNRAIRAVADVVNSPSGTLFILNDTTRSLACVHSWNMPPTTNFPASHPVVQRLINDREVVDLKAADRSILATDPLVQLGPVWLAIPLRHSTSIIGLIIVGPPRVAFRLDQEVFDLLGILGQEVGTHIAEQSATEAVFQTRSLHDYGKRFAFVAHDIKNISSQLALLLANAEQHLDNPEFQQDMLGTVRASVQKIDRLLKRLDEPSAKTSIEATSLVPRIKSLIENYRRGGQLNITLEHDGSEPRVVIGWEAFDTAISHLINNAIEAAADGPVLIAIQSRADRAIVEITDQGAGMSAEFIRDELFVPLKTSRSGGSGIGAFQARELINEAGGELMVVSQPNIGTTMRILLATVLDTDPRQSQRLSLGSTGAASD